MKHSKFLLSTLAALTLGLGSQLTAEEVAIGIVNLTGCMSDSKLGQQEQEGLQNLQNQMVSLMEDTEKEMKEIDSKLKDTDYLDSLSPQAEAELQAQREQLAKTVSQYQGQFYQMMQQAQYHMYQKVLGTITKAAEKIAEEKKLDYILNKEACFYIRPGLDVTSNVVSEMDRAFELDKAEKSAAAPDASSIHAIEESTLNAAG